jgi:ABC-type phosphate transport system auxiliary subunit
VSDEFQIERAGAQGEAKLAVTLTEREIRLMKLALDPSASAGEVTAASLKFVQSLRNRGIRGSEFDGLLEEEPLERNQPPERGVQAIILVLSREEAERMYKILEPMAMARPILLNLIIALRSMTAHDIRLQLKRNSADQLRMILSTFDSARQIFLNVGASIEAAGGRL